MTMHKKSQSYITKIVKHMKPNTVKTYITSIRKYESFHGITIDELIAEAIQEQGDNIPEHELSIYDRIMDFREYLIDNYKYSTVNQDLTRIKSIYKRSRVRLPYFPPLERKQCKHNPYIEYYEIISKEELVAALDWFKPNMKARIMTMATGGYSLEETDTMTIRQFIEDLYPYHHSDDVNQAMKILSEKDNIIWVTKMLRVKTGKPYFGMVNPETTQAIATSWTKKTIKDIDGKLFPQTKGWVSKHMGEVNDILGFGKAGGFRRFTPHTMRRYNATYLSGASLSYEEEMQVRNIDELQGRAMTDVQDRYIKTNPIKQKLLYAKVMNNVSLYNTYTYEIFDGDVVVQRVDPHKKLKKLTNENKELKKEVSQHQKADDELRKYIQSIGKDNFEARLSKLLQEL